jgi:hypothetical protein
LIDLEKQVKLACAGVAQPIKDMQTATGTKDSYTQYWIDDLLSCFKGMKMQNPSCDRQAIESDLNQWTVDNRDKLYSGFLTLKGEE